MFTLALTALVEAVEKTRLAATARPRTSSRASKNDSRAIPAAVRREVWARDEGRCAFVGTRGRCTETGFLEFHHVHPYAAGGESVAANTELRCRSHNQYEAELFFGVMEPRPPASALPDGNCLTRSGPSWHARTRRAGTFERRLTSSYQA